MRGIKEKIAENLTKISVSALFPKREYCIQYIFTFFRKNMDE